MSNLDELERLLEAATPGPWRLGAWSGRCHLSHQHGQGDCVYDPEFYPDVVQVTTDDPKRNVISSDYDGVDMGSEDAALIVAAVNALPALLAIARREERLRLAIDEILGTVYDPNIDTYTDKSYSALHLKAIRIAQEARAALTPEGGPA